MSKLCKNRTASEQIRLCNTINILLLICIGIFVVVSIFDLVQGLPIDSSRVAIFCCDVAILCFNTKNRKNAIEQLNAEKAG